MKIPRFSLLAVRDRLAGSLSENCRPITGAAFSLEPEELAKLAQDCGEAWEALGEVNYQMNGSETASLVFRRSLFIIVDVKARERLTEQNLRSIRPGHGLPPKYWDDVLGRRVSRNLSRGTPFTWDCLA